jgi:hypothetical protein
MEGWNTGNMEEGSTGSGAGLCAIGTQARAPPITEIPHHSIVPGFQHSKVKLKPLLLARRFYFNPDGWIGGLELLYLICRDGERQLQISQVLQSKERGNVLD